MTGKDIRNKLLEAGFTLADVALKMNTSPQNLNGKLNSKTIKIDFINELCAATGKFSLVASMIFFLRERLSPLPINQKYISFTNLVKAKF